MNAYRYQSAMIVDDMEIDIYVLRKLIHNLSFAKMILPFTSGNEALQYLLDSANKAELIPEIIFLDLRMPVLTGFGFLDLFEMLPDPIKTKSKIVIITSSLNPEEKKTALSNPFVHHLIEKPLSVDGLNQV